MLQLLKMAGLWGTSGPAANKELMGWVLGAGSVNCVWKKSVGMFQLLKKAGIRGASGQGAHAGWVEGGGLV